VDMSEAEIDKLIEKLADFEHKRWMEWSVNLTKIVPVNRDITNRWLKLWIPYAKLEEDHKEKNRRWARLIIDVLKEDKIITMSKN